MEKKPLYVCPQQGLIGYCAKEDPKTKGLISYPMMRGFSCGQLSPFQKNAAEQYWVSRFYHHDSKQTLPVPNFDLWLKTQITDSKKRLALLGIVDQILEVENRSPEEFSREFLYYAMKMDLLLKKPTQNKGKILFLQKILESLYYQRNKDIVNGESLFASLADHKVTQKALAAEFKEDLKNPRLKIFRQIACRGCNDNVKTAWHEFVSTVKEMEKEDALERLIIDLDGFRYTWLNSIFYNTWKNNHSIERVLNFFDEEKREKFTNYKVLCRAIESHLKEEDKTPGEFLEFWQETIEKSFRNFINLGYEEKITEKGFFDRYLARELLYHLIDGLDASTKKIQLKHPNEMPESATKYIKASQSILEKMISLKAMSDKEMKTRKTVKELHKALKGLSLETNWRMNSSISNFVLSGKPTPVTYGDLFTACHQTLLKAYSDLCGLDAHTIQKPTFYTLLKNYFDEEKLDVYNYDKDTMTSDLDSMNDGVYTKDGRYIEKFNIPLNNHSAIVTFELFGDQFKIHVLIPDGGGSAETRIESVMRFLIYPTSFKKDLEK
jgi:hypothetical protein